VDGKTRVDVASTLNVTGALALTSATDSTLNGTVNVGGISDLNVGGSLAITGDYTGGDNASLTVAGTTDLDGSLNITNDLQLDGTGAITLASSVIVSGNATVNGADSVTTSGTLDVTGALALISGADSTLTDTVNVGGISDLNVGGDLAITGDYTGGDKVTMTVMGSTDLDGTLDVANDLLLDGTGAITLANNVIVSGSATVNGDDSVTATGTLDVKDDLQITADKAISLSGTLKVGDTATGSALNLESAQNITVAAELSVQQINARSNNGDVRVVQQQAGDLSIGQIQAGNGAVSLSLLNGRLIGSPNSGLANVVAEDLSTAAKGFALSNEQSSDLVNSIEQLSSQPLRVDVDRLRLLQVSSSDLLFNATGDKGTGFVLSTGGLDSTLHLITTGNPDIETVVAPIEVTVEQFEQLRGLFFRSNAPDRDDIAIADVIARRHSEELSWFRERLSEDDLAAEDMTAYERQLQAALLSGAQSDTVRSLFTELLEPGFGLSESSEVSRVLGHVPGLQPLVTGDSPMNPYLYDMFMEDFQMVF
jgi:cytoskeletal protein CcmA (bactofilin family)